MTNQLDTEANNSASLRIPFLPFGIATSALFSTSYTLCVLFDLLLPDLAMHAVWEPLLPGFRWLTLPSFIIGFVETILYGFYVSSIFVPSFNWATKLWGGHSNRAERQEMQ